MRNYFILLTIVSLFFSGCKEKESVERDFLQSDYKNILDLSGKPESENSKNISCFFDNGSWFGFSLSDEKSGFSGPLLLQSNKWLIKSLAETEIFIDGKKSILKNIESSFLPGKLLKKFSSKNILVTQQVIFLSSQSALIATKITNTSNAEVNISAALSGMGFTTFASDKKNKTISIADNDEKITIASNTNNIVLKENRYSFNYNETALKASESKTYNLVVSSNFPKEANQETISDALKHPEKHLEKNTLQWNKYLNDALAVKSNMSKDSIYKRLGAKSVVTLIHNWRVAAGDLHYDGLFPSYAYQGFHGFWAWDSWKHAVALASFNPELAKNQIKAMFDYQDEAGMIADCIYLKKEWNNWRNTKSPIAVWAIYKVYEATNDGDFLIEMYPKAKKYHEWWYKYRDHDNDTLCEFGCTDGTLIAAKWESGMDNAVRFDDSKLLQNSENAWSLNQESVDLNGFLYLEKLYLANIAWILSEKDDALAFEQQSKKLKTKIRESFYDKEKNWYFDKDIDSDSLITVYGPEAFTILWTKIATHNQVNKMLDIIDDDEHFDTYIPFPTLDASHPKFNPEKGYWRGPVWIDQAYFGIKGLQNYRKWNESYKFRDKLLKNCEGLLNNAPIRENYHPTTGKGLNADHFSWSAAHFLMMYRGE
ncbi:MAG: trehalase family glycosidase [Bacteroidota bacterium]|nr:trehalase family glycosidase [Bacteroidota bacterium]